MTITETHASQHCYANFINDDLTPVQRAAAWDAYLILSDRERRTQYLPITNTSADLRLHARGRHCGRYTMEGVAYDGRDKRFARVNCKCWDCQYCGPRKAKRYKVVIGKEAERLHLSRLLTLTLDPKKTPVRGAVKEIKAVWARFRAQLRKRYGVAPNYICVMEFQHETKMPHLHVLIDRYIEWSWACRVWEQAGGGAHVDIRAGKKGASGFVDCHRIAHYLSKYLTKELMMSAPKRSRRVTTSKAVSLNARAATAALYAWGMMREQIFTMFIRNSKRAAELAWGSDSILQSFSVPRIQLQTT
jgi:hypothetical protein